MKSIPRASILSLLFLATVAAAVLAVPEAASPEPCCPCAVQSGDVVEFVGFEPDVKP